MDKEKAKKIIKKIISTLIQNGGEAHVYQNGDYEFMNTGTRTKQNPTFILSSCDYRYSTHNDLAEELSEYMANYITND